jgi:hypothetical protein
MKKASLFAIALAAILYAAPLSLHWSSNEMPSLSGCQSHGSKQSWCKQKTRSPPVRTERAVLCWQPLCQLPLHQSTRELRQSLR